MTSFQATRGFTLMEMIIALVILAIISLAVGNFLQFGAQSYLDTVHRDRSQQIARFALEKMSRELRHAAPNSVQTEQDGQCVAFYPVMASGAYWGSARDQSQLTVGWNSEAAPDIRVGDHVAIGYYGFREYERQRLSVVSLDVSAHQLNLNDIAIADSPGQRFYIYRQKVRFCVEQGALYRLIGDEPASPLNQIADHLVLPDPDQSEPQQVFSASGGAANFGVVQIFLKVQRERSDEVSRYNHTVQVINVL
ncbi:PilW family protein [Photobacterium sp. TY1-4]|uniref:PilW family protein n=1 Tax=Photobacterium sp. TY1-4 TaxID=2899122 RepID=UPI0021BFF132|nr:prepilin-type N-terminal cleavage/methylation domain-containing protein [Photobacterium sp. TY1-4]UXI01595.1 prepilin-type N-terminal cleavage/methylation domain-containing protein [Photobacterium sp. TY1-4]